MNFLNNFRGCLVGALFGDCFGAPFEGERRAAKTILNNYFLKLSDQNVKVPFKPYTDDAAMTRALAESLIDKKELHPEDLARKFVKEYFNEPDRGYGRNVVDVFAALRATNFKDVFAPAAIQFDGSGSYGNGGAMRVAPVALFCHDKSLEYTANLARLSALVTHSNRLGVNGAILQCLAVHQALNCASSKLDPYRYLDTLSHHMKIVEKFKSDEFVEKGEREFVYVEALEVVRKLLDKGNEVSIDTIEHKLGSDISADRSVPTAIFVFLRSFSEIETIQTSDPFQRTLHFAISLGGDTDTIASMAGSIAGAYYGLEKIPQFMHNRCESTELFIQLADELHATTQANNT